MDKISSSTPFAKVKALEDRWCPRPPPPFADMQFTLKFGFSLSCRCTKESPENQSSPHPHANHSPICFAVLIDLAVRY